jgi:carbonic anhydrase
MERLLTGYEWFRTRVYPNHAHRFARLSDSQNPQALLITCADSRIDPSLLLQCEPGDLFLCRNAGNIVPPGHCSDASEGCGVAATIEYAIEVLKIPDIVVLGHSDCGAMKGVMNPENLANKPAVAKWLKHAADFAPHSHACLRTVTESNIVKQVSHLEKYATVAAAIAENRVRVHGWYYDMPAGELHELDSIAGQFKPLYFPAWAVNRGTWQEATASAA